MRRSVALLLALTAATACKDAPPPPLEVSLNLKTIFGSCGREFDYDTTCLAGLLVRAVGADGREQTVCRALNTSERPSTLFALVTQEPLVQIPLSGLSSPITFEVRGLHDRASPNADGGVPDVCESAQEVHQWLFWGSSAPQDIAAVAATDAGLYEVQVRVDCRDCEGGCESLGQDAQCPATLPLAYCVPPVTLDCAARCTDGCFDGALACSDDGVTCDKASGGGGFCSSCASTLDCRDGLRCVGRPDDGFCATPCPAASAITPACPSGSACVRVGAGRYSFVPPTTTETVDGGS